MTCFGKRHVWVSRSARRKRIRADTTKKLMKILAEKILGGLKGGGDKGGVVLVRVVVKLVVVLVVGTINSVLSLSDFFSAKISKILSSFPTT